MSAVKSILIYLLFSSTLISHAQKVECLIKPDGTFDVKGTTVQLINCYPALDNISLKPVRLNISKKGTSQTIQYILLNGMVELQFVQQGSVLTIKPTVTGKLRPGMISIIRDAEVLGAQKVYRTSTQILGNGGLKKWPVENWDYSSCGSLTGLVPDSGNTMIISTRDYKKYMSYTNAYPTSKYGGKKMVDICLATESVVPTLLPIFYFTEGNDAQLAMLMEAKAIGDYMGAKNDKKQSYHWCSWYYAYYNLTDTTLVDYLKSFEMMKPRVPVQTIQIDAGYHPHAGDWLEPSHKFPKGLAPSVQEIINRGYKAGVWIGPYMVGNKSKVYLNHPDWILRYNNGTPIINMAYYAEERLWGATDEEIYTLDTSNPEVMEHLRSVFRAFRKMGITFFKTDFMLFGAQGSQNIKRHTPGKTSHEYQREFFEMIRQEIGSESFWLGCIAPFQAMIGYADGMRISADITPKWEGGTTMFNESKGNNHINNVWWQNDPDAMILRNKYTQLNDTEAHSLIMWMGMMGGMINTSDLFKEIPKERTELFRYLEPSDSKEKVTFPYLEKNDKLDIMAKYYAQRKAYGVLFTNRTEESVSGKYEIASLTPLAYAFCFEWQVDKNVSLGKKSNIEIQLKPHESKLIYLSLDGNSPAGINFNGKEIK